MGYSLPCWPTARWGLSYMEIITGYFNHFLFTGETPLSRELTDDEIFLLNEIRDSDEESIPKCKKKAKMYSAKNLNNEGMLDISNNIKLLCSKERCQQHVLNVKPSSSAQNSDLPSGPASVTETPMNANPNSISEVSFESQTDPKPSSPEKSY